MIKKLALLSFINAEDKFYIDYESLNTSQDAFHIHLGHNIWVQTNAVYKDDQGFYALESSLSRAIGKYNNEIERKWKCPYCYHYWPIGRPCGNKDCPSRFK
jgi:hypothetical protein